MKALLWKDYRVNLLVLAFGVAVLVGLPLLALALNLHGQLTIGSAPRPWSELLVHTTPFGLAIQLLTMAMLGGNAVASERADRSAEFLAYLPPSRWAIITSKAIFAISVGLFIWGVSLAIIYVVAPAIGAVTAELIDFRDSTVPVLAATSVLLFGAAWFGSTFLPSHTLATGFGIVLPIALLCSLWSAEYFLELRGFDVGWWYRTLCIPLGVAFFAAGVVYYTRRVEP
jgi:ABC-type transport system involved in multi-copper enzyme maturation permease subunit